MADFLYLGVFRLLAVGILSQQTVDTLQFLSSPHWLEDALSREAYGMATARKTLGVSSLSFHLLPEKL